MECHVISDNGIYAVVHPALRVERLVEFFGKKNGRAVLPSQLEKMSLAPLFASSCAVPRRQAQA
jgi:hypothetical protein